MARKIVGLILLLLGAVCAFAGVSYQTAGGLHDPSFPRIGVINAVANQLLGLPQAVKGIFMVNDYGLLLLGGGLGGLLALIGLYLLATKASPSVKKPAAKKEKAPIKVGKEKHDDKAKEADSKPAEKAAPAAAATSAPATAESTDSDSAPADDSGAAEEGGSLDDLIADSEDAGITEASEGAESLFDSADNLIALSHGALPDALITKIVEHYYPGVVPYLDRFNEEGRKVFARQAVNHAILVLKRTDKGIAADQFKLQDERMNELERATIARLYAPQDMAGVSEEGKQHIGMAYPLLEQSRIQQQLMTSSADWADISLRNAAAVFKDSPAPTNSGSE